MENILQLVPEPKEEFRKPKMYKSMYNPKMPPTGSTFLKTRAPAGAAVGMDIPIAGKQRGRSFGTALGHCRPDPTNYLKKGAKSKQAAAMKKEFRRKKENVKPKVPSQKDTPVMGLQSTKNYVTANAVEAILAVPGNRTRVKEQQPQYRHKVDFGRVPAYLTDVKAEIERENEMIEEYLGVAKDEGPESGEMLQDGEVKALVDELKMKWGDVNKKYQRLTHQTKLDTIGKVRRKEALEKELDVLEKNIQKLEGKNVEIMPDQEYYY